MWYSRYVLLVVLALGFPPAAVSQCRVGGALCDPASVTESGPALLSEYHVEFSTDNQSMWQAGARAGSFSPAVTVPVLDRSRARFGRSSPYTAGRVREYCFFDELRSLLSGVEIFTYSLGFVVDTFEDEFSNPCYDFGADVRSDFRGSAGLSLELDSEVGAVSVSYPVSLTLSSPAVDQFNPGETIELRLSAVPLPGVSLSTESPDGGVILEGAADTRLHARARGCIDDCTSVDLVGPVDLAGSQRSGMVGVAGLKYELATFNPVDMLTNPDTSLLNFLAGSAGIIGIPRIDAAGNVVTAGDFSVAASGSDVFIDLAIDLDLWLSRVSGSPFSLTSKSLSVRGVSLQSSSIDGTVNLRARYLQDFVYNPTFLANLTLPEASSWEVVNDVGVVLRSGSGRNLQLAAGEVARIDSTPFTAVGDIQATALQRNEFSNLTEIETISSVDMYALRYRFTTPSATIFSPRCWDFGLGEICTERMRWSGEALNYGPAVAVDGIGETTIDYPVLDQRWELQGFQSFPLRPVRLDPNRAPQMRTSVINQILFVGIARELDAGRYFYDPDGNSLRYQLRSQSGEPLPFDLVQNGARFTMRAQEPFAAIPVQLVVDDGNRASYVHNFRINGIVPVVPALPLWALALVSLLLCAVVFAVNSSHRTVRRGR